MCKIEENFNNQLYLLTHNLCELINVVSNRDIVICNQTHQPTKLLTYNKVKQ